MVRAGIAAHGKVLADRLRQVRPGLRVLFMSGYTENDIADQGVLDEDTNFLPKPFGPVALLQKVRGVLDRPAPPQP